MVTAGVYLVARASPLYTQVPDIGMLVAWVGVATALLAALIACAQVDLKKILAYSTVSQLGYMFVGVGVGAYTDGIFQLLTHGFFKALLFLGAGSIIHAAHSNNMSDMGGLKRYMPVTFWTFLIGSLACGHRVIAVSNLDAVRQRIAASSRTLALARLSGL